MYLAKYHLNWKKLWIWKGYILPIKWFHKWVNKWHIKWYWILRWTIALKSNISFLYAGSYWGCKFKLFRSRTYNYDYYFTYLDKLFPCFEDFLNYCNRNRGFIQLFDQTADDRVENFLISVIWFIQPLILLILIQNWLEYHRYTQVFNFNFLPWKFH